MVLEYWVRYPPALGSTRCFICDEDDFLISMKYHSVTPRKKKENKKISILDSEWLKIVEGGCDEI